MPILISLLVIITLSLTVIRVGAVALTMTGLSRDVASFQAMSCFLGVGFTTSEAEYIVSHPVRRRIARILMLLGTAGVTSSVATLVLTFTQEVEGDIGLLTRFEIVIGSLIGLYLLARSRLLDHAMTIVIRRALAAATRLELSDYEELLELSHGYAVAQLPVKEGAWMSGKALAELDLISEGIVVLNMTRRKGTVLGTPTRNTVVQPGDELLCYGRAGDLEDLAEREGGTAGDEAHEAAIARHAARRHAEVVEDSTRKEPPAEADSDDE
jgi:hypothetical protein